MRGLIGFHPVDRSFFDELIEPLVAGEKVNPDEFLARGVQLRAAVWHSHVYKESLAQYLESLEPAPLPADGTLWSRVRTRLERFDHRPDPTALRVAAKIEPELHLEGRPFLITESTAEKVAGACDEFMEPRGDDALAALVRRQLERLDQQIAVAVEPIDRPLPCSAMQFRADLLNELREIFDLAAAARDGSTWGNPSNGMRRASDVLAAELPWRVLRLHSRAVPCWLARDVDGLASVCRAAGVAVPQFLLPPWKIFNAAVDEFPRLRGSSHIELEGKRDVAAYVRPADLPQLLSFLGVAGSRIICAAARHGEGPACATLLKKIRECAHYAERSGMGYIESVGIRPVEQGEA